MAIFQPTISGGGGSMPELYRVLGTYAGRLVNSSTTPFIPLPNTVSNIDSYVMYMAYYNTPSSILYGNIDLSNLTSLSGEKACYRMFMECSGITSVDLSNLSVVSSNSLYETFKNCSGITVINLSNLKTVTAVSALNGCFEGCTSLSVADFPSLERMSSGAAFQMIFKGCTSLTRVSFYALTPSSFGSFNTQFASMLSGVTGCTVHFPMAIQSIIGSWGDVTNGFGGTNTTVLFDIVTSLTGADTNTYTRMQKESTQTATAWTYNNTLYYTSGTTEPSVGDTIYSDSACTTAVTTISSLA